MVKNMYNKNYYDSPLNGFNSLNVNSRRYYASLSNNKHNIYDLEIDPWFITGFSDGEGCFTCSVLKSSSYKFGWEVQLCFQIKLHVRDYPILLRIKHSLGGIGTVSSNQSSCAFRVKKLSDLIELMIFFDKYPLITKKHADYILFKQIINLMVNKEHNTLEGIQKIVNIKASLNTGLAENLNKAFPNTIPSQRLEDSNIPQGNKINPEWMAGFCTGESNFFITIAERQKSKIGFTTWLRFSIAQHSRDLLLLESFVVFFNCGHIANYKNRLICEFIVTKIDHILEYIIPFFIKHPILGSKYLNYLKFNSAAEIIKNKEHLNSNGLERILQLKKNTINNHRED